MQHSAKVTFSNGNIHLY